MRDPEIHNFFVRAIQRVCPKSVGQAEYEVLSVRNFLQNISGDSPAYIARGTTTAGIRTGQQAQTYRWPLGPCMHICQYNYPLRTPAIQMMSALITGNKILVKVDPKVSLVIEQFIRLLLKSGLPPTDVDLMHTDADNARKFVTMTPQIKLI